MCKKGWIPFYVWNPQKNRDGRKWWDEIWEKMDGETWTKYLKNLEDLLIPLDTIPIRKKLIEKEFHAAKPDICWEALVKTLGT